MARIIADFDLEKALMADGYSLVIGIDEAGRGPLAGPVVACAAAARSLEPSGSEDEWKLVRDSKTLSERQRGIAFDFVKENFQIGIGICDHETIDRLNILEATFLAMKKALTELSNGLREIEGRRMIIVDGSLEIPNLSAEQRPVVSGDSLSKSIAAASIIAKVTRDRIMLEADERYPLYGFRKHKGYGTKLHMDLLAKHGPCEIHRRSFDPVKKALRRPADSR